VKDEPIQLIEPTEAMREAYMDFLSDFSAAGEKDIDGSGAPAGKDFGAFIRRLRNHSRGADLPNGWVPATMYWLVRGRRILGACNLRHALTEALRDFGGHVGYSVRPGERNKGYGTLMFKLVLEKAWALGIARVLVTCDRNNVPSIRVIEKNGGVLDSESHSERAGRVTRRYWIDLGQTTDPPTDAEQIELIEPTLALREAYVEFMESFAEAGEETLRGPRVAARADPEAEIRKLLDAAEGKGLPEGWVPQSRYWLVRGGRIIGTCGVRHRLTKALLDFGGHIGYAVRPDERNKGYATLMLKLALEKARALGIRRVRITCDKGKIASARVIQKNGGVLDSESHSARAGRVVRRYWIDV